MIELLMGDTRECADDIMQMVSSEGGFLIQKFLADETLKNEFIALFVAAEASAVDLTDEKDDIEQSFALRVTAAIGMFDVLLSRHPEFISQLHAHQLNATQGLDNALARIFGGRQ